MLVTPGEQAITVEDPQNQGSLKIICQENCTGSLTSYWSNKNLKVTKHNFNSRLYHEQKGLLRKSILRACFVLKKIRKIRTWMEYKPKCTIITEHENLLYTEVCIPFKLLLFGNQRNQMMHIILCSSTIIQTGCQCQKHASFSKASSYQ